MAQPGFVQAGEPDFTKMIDYHEQKFWKLPEYLDIEEGLSQVQLYEDVPPLKPEEMFAKEDWHPGPQPQNNYACLIHAFNMYVGGPLFTSAAQFLALYQSRTHMRKIRSPEFEWEKGLSLRNLRKIIYNPRDRTWLSPLVLATASRAEIQKCKDHGLDPSDMVESWIEGFNRAIVQYTTVTSFDAVANSIMMPSCHSSVVFKRLNTWWFLDSAEDKPINLRQHRDAADEWIKSIDQANFYVMEQDQPSKSQLKALLTEWDLIMKGILVGKKGGSHKRSISKRKLERKDQRNDEQRPPSTTTRPKKPRPPLGGKRSCRQAQVLGNNAPMLTEEERMEALRHYTQEARDSRQRASSKEDPSLPQEVQGEDVVNRLMEFMIKEQTRLELLMDIRKRKKLPGRQELLHEFHKYAEREMVNEVFEEAFLRGDDDYRRDLYIQMGKEFEKQESMQGRQVTQLGMEQHMTHRMDQRFDQYKMNQMFSAKKLIKECPELPVDYFCKYCPGMGEIRLGLLREWKQAQFPFSRRPNEVVQWRSDARAKYDLLISKFSSLDTYRIH